MKFFAVYDENGVILRHGRCSDVTLELQGDLVLDLPTEPPEDFDLGYYVLDGEATQRPLFDLPDELTLVAGTSSTHAIPDPCKVTLDGVEHNVVGGSIEFAGEMPATYEFAFECWPYINHKLKVTVE